MKILLFALNSVISVHEPENVRFMRYGRHFLPALVTLFSICFLVSPCLGQLSWQQEVDAVLPEVLQRHREIVAMPNVAANHEDMLRNAAYMEKAFGDLGFSISLLESTSLPVFLAEKEVDPSLKTLLFYFHLDGQPVNPEKWTQDDPFVPVLRKKDGKGGWEDLSWDALNESIDPEWRIFGRAAADDKGPITMMLTALELMAEKGKTLPYNMKVILDLQEEAGSHAFMSTIEDYKTNYAADYMIIMDGPAHYTNVPTLTFGCRGIARCDITVYGAKLPQHSGHFGNYAPNPVFRMAHLLASMKNEYGTVVIDHFYDGIELDAETRAVLEAIPDKNMEINQQLVIHTPDKVGETYQESLQFPSLNVRHIETSWKGPGLKTVIPEYCTAHIDVRLVKETDGIEQIKKVKKHIESEGFLVLDREPTDIERMNYPLIATFNGNGGVNAFRTETDSPLGMKLQTAIGEEYKEDMVLIRTMGGTIPIIPAVNALDIPAVIVPMVNMDNNQHAPNENIRIGNMIDGIHICLAILNMELD